MELFDAVKEIKILEVAEALAINVTSHHGGFSMAICPFHEDHKGGGGKPNLSLLTNVNRFKCHKCGEKGSVLDLWMKLTNQPDAVVAAKAMAQQFHVQYDDDFIPAAKKPKPKNPYVAKEWDLAVVDQAHQNLMSEASKEHLEHLKKIRNLTDEYIVQKKIGLMEVWGIDNGNCADLAYTVPILDAAGTTLYGVRTHSRIVRRNKKCIGSKFIKGGGQYQNLYDLRSYQPDGPELHVVEGEGDLWTAECLLKLNAITAPLGAVNIPTILAQNMNALGDLSKKEKIVLYPDNDFSGLRCMARIRTRMPKEAKVYIVHWPDTYPEKEDLSYWFLTLGKTHAELETLIKVYPFEEAEAWLKKHQEMIAAAKNQAIRVHEYGNCYFKKVHKKTQIEIEDEDEGPVLVDGKPADAAPPISEVEETLEVLESLPKDADLHDDLEEEKDKYELVRISSFVIRGKAILDIDREGWLRADIETVDGRVEKNITIPPKAWRSKRDFIDSNPHVKYVFQGTDRDVMDIMQLATKNIPKNMMKKGVHFIGFVDGYFVGPDFAISKDGIVENAPVEYVKKGAGSEFERHLKIHTAPDLKATLKHFCELILKVNRADVTLTMLGWMFACFFKAQIHKIIRYFPIFSIFGTSGAGKTSLSLAFLRLCGLGREFKLFNANSTWFATSTTLASTDCIPMFVDELKETIGKDLVNLWLQRIRSTYMGETEVRGTKDQTTRSTTYRAPLATVGETSICREQATAERTIKITPERAFIEQNKDAKSAFYALDNVVQTEALFPKIVQWCLLEGFPQTHAVWYATKERLAYMKLPTYASRVIDNYAVVLFGLTMF